MTTTTAPRRSPPGGARARRAGFTLLEVVLAVTIFGLVATAIYGTFSRTLRSKRIAEGRMDVVRTGRIAVNRIADEIATAAPDASQVTGEKKFLAVDAGDEAAPLASLAFWTLGSRGGPEDFATDQRMIEYFFTTEGRSTSRRSRRATTVATGALAEDAAAGPGRRPGRERDVDAFDLFAGFGAEALHERGIPAERLLRRESLLIQRNGNDDAYATVFLDNVASLRFRFCDGTTWLDTWDSDDRANYAGGMPRAVAIDLGLYDENGAVHHFATAVDLIMVKQRVGAGTCPPWGDERDLGRRRP
jgi:prepilin-type N-terminal cleavage/methylation domain-containing protein